jgi:putative glycosyltransferase
MRITVVATLYHSSPYIEEFYQRSVNALASLSVDYDFIFVNDGSPDDVFEKARVIADADNSVKIVDLSRNFGHHRAAMTGLQYAEGDLVFLVDVDLEEEPELVIPFFNKLRESGADVVYGVQESRKGGGVERLCGKLYYKVFNLLSSVKIPEDLLMARLMTSRYVKSLVSHRESQFDISGLWSLTGYEQIPLSVKKHSKGETTYTFAKRFGVMLQGLVSFSNRPLLLIAGMGGVILTTAFLYFIYLLSVYIFVGNPPTGFTTLILSIWFLGGLTIFCLGVIAMYMSVIFIETKHRPYSIVRDVYQSGKEDQGGKDNE